MDRNISFLIACIDDVHGTLCPDHIGTWQDRAKKICDAARKIKEENEKLKLQLKGSK